MRPEMLSLPLALLFLAISVPSHALSGAEEVALRPHVFEVGRQVALRCELPAPRDADVAFSWRKNGTEVSALPELAARVETNASRADAYLVLRRALEDDFGNYTCWADGLPVAGWALGARPLARLPDNTNVVEGQKLKLVCKLVGKPYTPVSWTYSNGTDNGTDALAALGGRAQLQKSDQDVEGGVLLLEAAERSDAGTYWCSAQGGTADRTVLLVKDKYAALWPFLGICAEVVVLCAVILLYEKRRTKADLDDSDADNNDQKKS